MEVPQRRSLESRSFTRLAAARRRAVASCADPARLRRRARAPHRTLGDRAGRAEALGIPIVRPAHARGRALLRRPGLSARSGRDLVLQSNRRRTGAAVCEAHSRSAARRARSDRGEHHLDARRPTHTAHRVCDRDRHRAARCVRTANHRQPRGGGEHHGLRTVRELSVRQADGGARGFPYVAGATRER